MSILILLGYLEHHPGTVAEHLTGSAVRLDGGRRAPPVEVAIAIHGPKNTVAASSH